MALSSKSLKMAVASLMLVAGLACAGTALADGDVETCNGHEDKWFSFDLSFFGTTAGTAGEEKYETSPLMIYPTSISFDTCRVYGEGSQDSDGAWADGSVLTIGGYGTVYDGDEDQRLILRTNIKEYGYTYARLTAYRSSGSGNMQGWWSSDCYEQGTDIVINAGYR